MLKRAASITHLLLTLTLVVTQVSAQRRRAPTPKTPPTAPTVAPVTSLDNILAADSYKIYGEVRGVGQLFRSPGVSDILEPVMKLAAPPKEFKTLISWLNSQADALMSARLMLAVWPARPHLPQLLFAIEFPSSEEAQKFEPQLKGFLPKILPPHSPEGSAKSDGKGASLEAGTKDTPPLPQYILKRSGPVVFISDVPFTLKNLRPPGSKLLAEGENFRQVHNRFNSESIFLYFDVALVEKEDYERLRRMEEEEKKRQENEVSDAQKSVVDNNVNESTPSSSASAAPEVDHITAPSQVVEEPTSAGLDKIATAFWFGRPRWPQAIGVAFAFESDAYVVRALLVNSPDLRGSPIPLIPHLISGPALAQEASLILPADSEMVVTASLDYPLMYEGLIKTLARQSEAERSGVGQSIKDTLPESPFAAYETKLGIKLKEDLLPLLGNEIAVTVPVKFLGLGPKQPGPPPISQSQSGETETTPPSPAKPELTIAISVKDREAVRAVIPKIINSLGFPSASLLAQTEKRDDTELVTYGDVVSYAFVGNFLVVSPDTKAIKHVVDSYLNHRTLASDSNFKNYTRWQPRQLLGQVYVSPALMEAYLEVTRDPNSRMPEKVRDFLSRLSPTAEPLTYALSDEGQGPFHELHVPKNLVMLLVAGIAGDTNQPPHAVNEALANSALRTLASAELTYQATVGNGNFGTLDQLIDQGLVQKDLIDKRGYKIELTAVGAKFEATATPIEYGKTGKISFFIDESSVVRAGDRAGAPATIMDRPLQ